MKKNGFTLVELVVGIAISSIILTMLGALLFFTTQSNNKIVLNEKYYNNASTIRNIISVKYDSYYDETLTIEKNNTYTSLFKTDTHSMVFKENNLYFDNEMIFTSQFDVNIETLLNPNTITYKITYNESDTLKLVKGR